MYSVDIPGHQQVLAVPIWTVIVAAGVGLLLIGAAVYVAALLLGRFGSRRSGSN
jgi:hypothetical protein